MGLAAGSSLVDDEERGLRWDFILMTLMRGNDYLPPLFSAYAPEDLWLRYLKWRRANSPKHGLVSREGHECESVAAASGQGVVNAQEVNTAVSCRSDVEHLTLRQVLLADFMACCAERSAALQPPVPAGRDEAAKGVGAYLCGLMWCLDTYVNGGCLNFHFRFPKTCKPCASATLIAEHAAAIPAAVFATVRDPLRPLSPSAFAMAVLPVTEVRALILPTAPWLAPILEEGSGILGEVARLESCSMCACLTAAATAVLPDSKRGAKRHKALQLHRSQHKDIDDVPLDDLDAEVQRLCQEFAGSEQLANYTGLVREVTLESSLAPSSSKRPSPDGAAAGIASKKVRCTR